MLLKGILVARAAISLCRRHAKMVLIPASIATRPKIRVTKLQRKESEFLKSFWHQCCSGLCISRAYVNVVLPRLCQTSRKVPVSLYLELIAGFCYLIPYPSLRRRLEFACKLCKASSLDITLLMLQTFSRALLGLPLSNMLTWKVVKKCTWVHRHSVFKLIVAVNFNFCPSSLKSHFRVASIGLILWLFGHV